MILSASRRTDIPCYFSEWLLSRLKAGYVLVRNPMNHKQLSKIPLSPETVDCIVFWTKDAANILPYLGTIDSMGYRYYFQFTLTPYDKTIEKNLRDKTDIENTFIELSQTIGKEKVLWRYDPILLNDRLTVSYHEEQFARLCDKLHPYTESVTISFVDIYKKLKTNLVRETTDDEMARLSAFIGKTARVYGLTAKACCEKADLSIYGIQRASCIDREVIERICGYPLKASVDKNQREGCGCMESVDIGAYNTCINGCIYCYANWNILSARRRFASHNPKGELLIGMVGEGEEIRIREVKSLRQGQMMWF